MSITLIESGFAEEDFGTTPFGAGFIQGYMGFQAEAVIKSEQDIGSQTQGQIVDILDPQGVQSQGVINSTDEFGMQVEGTINSQDAIGMQIGAQIKDNPNPVGIQALAGVVDQIEQFGMQVEGIIKADSDIGFQTDGNIVDFQNLVGQQTSGSIVDVISAYAMEAKSVDFPHWTCGGFATGAFGTSPFAAETICAMMSFQAEAVIQVSPEIGIQSEGNIVDFQNALGIHASGNILEFLNPLGFQADSVAVAVFGMQARSVLYNTTNLRIICEFPSRGTSGTNWTASSTEPGDFLPQNLNTDIVEQIWRTATGVTSSINLDVDTEIPQGVFLDTLGILNHNITTSGTVTMLGSNSATFATIGVTIPLVIEAENMYYISPDLPISSFRYWRFVVDDPTNTDSFVSIGTIVFGAAQIFSDECFTDQIPFGLEHFSDKISTEGFTNVSNDRAVKKNISLDFRSLRFGEANFNILKSTFNVARTNIKCLWIPFPIVPSRFAVFAKLTQIPQEQHNFKAANANFVSLKVELKESL